MFNPSPKQYNPVEPAPPFQSIAIASTIPTSTSPPYANASLPVTPDISSLTCREYVTWIMRVGVVLYWLAFIVCLFLILLLFDPLGRSRLRRTPSHHGDFSQLAKTHWRRRMDWLLYLFGQTERLHQLTKIAEYLADILEICSYTCTCSFDLLSSAFINFF